MMISTLRRATLFHEIPDNALEHLASSSQVLEYSPGYVLIEQGDPGDALYLVIEGSVSILRDGMEITRRGPGECVGEMALIDNAPRSASVVAAEHVRAIRITRDNFWRMIERYPSVARHLLRLLTSRIRQDTLRQMRILQERAKREQDLRRAAEIQKSMLPSGELKVGDLHLWGACVLAETVGGDYFDYVALPDGRVCCIIADGRGHGIDAALLVALIRSALHTQIRTDPSPTAVMNALEQVVIDAGKRTHAYVTCCYMLFEGDRFHYINAGHPYPLLCREERIIELEATNMPLGFGYLDPHPYNPLTVKWLSGDGLMMYSDGIVESESPEGDLFGFERLFNLVAGYHRDPPYKLGYRIFSTLNEFRGGRSPVDDITIVLIKRY
ncbi:TPA: cyclic nucleotide-binding domain-containing protein [Candidatus Poribacteria bacterium]|nr:cyclic nucleotide-binding domain-containing protein [Candidatus Poribacteria bacterium]